MADIHTRIDQFKKMATDDPNNELGHFSLGRAYLEAGIYDNAATSFERVIEINPNPWLDNRAEFAMAARRAKPEMSHGDVIERIVELAMAHPIRERSAI